jgi:hypothetical protein
LQADATGALEAVKAALGSLPQDRVATRFLLAAASDISTSDVDLAFASGGIILGFNVEPSEAVISTAKQLGACLYARSALVCHATLLCICASLCAAALCGFNLSVRFDCHSGISDVR